MATETAAYGVYTGKVMLDPVWCPNCGTPFGIAEQFMAERRRDHRTFYCPNGHTQYYAAESEEERLRKELKREGDRAARLTAERDQMEASRRAWKGQATKVRNRALKGECPLCGKHVYQLERHVARQHPGEPTEHPEPSAD